MTREPNRRVDPLRRGLNGATLPAAGPPEIVAGTHESVRLAAELAARNVVVEAAIRALHRRRDRTSHRMLCAVFPLSRSPLFACWHQARRGTSRSVRRWRRHHRHHWRGSSHVTTFFGYENAHRPPPRRHAAGWQLGFGTAEAESRYCYLMSTTCMRKGPTAEVKTMYVIRTMTPVIRPYCSCWTRQPPRHRRRASLSQAARARTRLAVFRQFSIASKLTTRASAICRWRLSDRARAPVEAPRSSTDAAERAQFHSASRPVSGAAGVWLCGSSLARPPAHRGEASLTEDGWPVC